VLHSGSLPTGVMEVKDHYSDPDVVDDFDRDQYAGLSDDEILRVKRARDQWELQQIRKRLDENKRDERNGA
jgi:hypothetical protein